MSTDDPAPCLNLIDWACDAARMDASLDASTLWQACDTLSAMGAAHAGAGRLGEWRAALVKMLAQSIGAQTMAGSEKDVFASTAKLREAIYFETMQYRRAAQRDIAAGTLA